MIEEQYKSHCPREIQEMVDRIIDRKSGYQIGQIKQVTTFSDEQEEKIRKLKATRVFKNTK